MEITVKSKRSFIGKSCNELFSVPNSWMQHLTWVLPSSIKIASSKRAPVVAVDDAIRVHHWNNFEDIVVSEVVGSGVVANEEVNDTLHHVGRVRLSRMDSGSNYYTLFLSVLFYRASVCDRQILTLVASNCSAQSVSAHVVEFALLDFAEVFGEHSVSVGLGVGEVDGIIIVFEGEGESKRREAPLLCKGTDALVRVFSSVVVLKVTDVFTSSGPSFFVLGLARMFLPLLRVEEHLHAIVVERLALYHVEHVELHFLSLLYVAHPEEEPLGVAL